MLILNEVDKIIDIINFDDEELKIGYKSTPGNKPRKCLSISQLHSIRFVKLFNCYFL